MIANSIEIVDDETIVMRAVSKGWRFNKLKDKLEYSEKK